MSKELKRARQEAGLTVLDLINKAGVSRATLNNAERGQAIRIEYAYKIVNALNELSGKSYTIDDLSINTN